MDYEIIFYHSGKTAEIEKTLSESLVGVGLEMSESCAAIHSEELAYLLSSSLSRSDIVFIIGGLDGGKQSTDKILSGILSAKSSNIKSNKLIDDDGNIAYIIRSDRQSVIVLPDDSDIIKYMMNVRIKEELRKIYSLNEWQEDSPSVENITQELDRQLSQTKRVPTNLMTESMTNNEKSLTKYRVFIIVLLSLGLIQAALAVILAVIG